MSLVAVVSSSTQLLSYLLGVQNASSLQYGICIVVVIEYICIAAVYFALFRKTIPNYHGRKKLRRGILRTLAIAAGLVYVAVPGIVSKSWRLSFEAVRHLASRNVDTSVSYSTRPQSYVNCLSTMNTASVTYHSTIYQIEIRQQSSPKQQA
ncbi:hypothetical protein N7495_003293 [Penicillium taxi]|uniref:uncharacterized protein n=1 Tax=Penicillium taxi TaxID=168475 RepID=UPI002544D34E|nr:uncharacterized protein N7495_003293 [Penicillium taxi]KAJ5902765.1 hypothetical protein N7495_003293 [Penicillium taxi]